MENIFTFLTDNQFITIVVFAIIQLRIFLGTLLKLYRFSHYLPKNQGWDVEERNNHYVIKVKEGSKGFEKLVREINEYLEKNEGTTDYNIIKDKVQCRLDAMYEDATSKVSFPTYLGLMGTFVGVYIGLESFKIGVGGQGLTGNVEVVSDTSISQLINGITVSMITSLVGLLLMICGNAIAGNVLKNVEERKTKFFDFIQVNLMPVLGTSMVSALTKLHGTINTFEPAFKEVIREFKNAFSECTETLRGAFGEKVQLLTTAVDTMGSNMSLINENVKMQDQLLKTMKQRETLKTLERFITAADKFDSVTTSISRLSDVKEQIADSNVRLIAAQTDFIEKMSIPERVFDKINTILNRIITFENAINALGESVSQTQLLGNSQMNLIQEQIAAIQRKTDLAVSYQEISDDELRNLYENQTNVIEELNVRYRAAIDAHGDNFVAAMNDFKSAYERVVQECLDAVEAKREEFIAEIRKSLDLEAKNQYLSNLDKMPELMTLLSAIRTDVKGQPEVLEKVSNVLARIREVKQALDSMNEKIAVSSENIKPSNEPEKPSIWSIFGKK